MSEIEFPEYHEQGMGCGLEDQGITDRYEACRYGYEQALEDVNNDVVKDLERQLADEKAKTKALLVGLEVQHFNDFINRANVENYKELGENITIGFKTQLKEQG